MMNPMSLLQQRAAWIALTGGLALGPAAAATFNQQLSSGTGYAAHEICTRTLQSHDDLWRVEWLYVAPAVSPLGLIWSVDQTPGSGTTVRTIIPGAENPSQAVYRSGLGCTTVPPGTSVQSVLSLPLQPHSDPPPSPAPWPAGEGAAQPQSLTPGQLAAVAQQGNALFTETGLLPSSRQNTYAYLVAKDGRLVYERYAAGYCKDQPQHAWSMTKSLTSLMVGAAETDGRLDLDDTPAVAQLQQGAKAAVHWRELLQMASGLQWSENFGTYGSTAEMLWLQPDQGQYVASQPLVATPGSVFNYSTGNFSLLSLGLKQALGGSAQDIHDYYQNRLFAPLGMRNAVVEVDVTGTPSGGAYGVLRPRDWLRLGQLVLNRGSWNGQTLISPGYIDFMQAPSPANAGYGAGLWRYGSLNMPADLPQDTVVFWGLNGQYLVLIPSKQLAVLRMGVSLLDVNFNDNATRQSVFSAVRALLQVF